MTRRHRRLDAYRDGALAGRARRRFERELERSPELAAEAARREALGALVREAWSDGPPPRSPEYLIAALRPELARIDRERAGEPAWRRGLEGLRRFALPASASALAGAALALAVVLDLPAPRFASPQLPAAPRAPGPDLASAAAPPAAEPFAPALAVEAASPEPAGFGLPSGVYDVAQGDGPLMLFEAADGTVVFWLIEEDDTLSSLPGRRAGRA